MDAVLLQDWVTLGAFGNTSLVQSEERWLDVEHAVDLTFWIQTAQVDPGAGTVRLALQTAPSRTELAFAASDVVNPPSLASPGVQVINASLKTALLPASRWLRWQLINTGATPWRVTFRVWVSFSRPGRSIWAPATPPFAPSGEPTGQVEEPRPRPTPRRG